MGPEAGDIHLLKDTSSLSCILDMAAVQLNSKQMFCIMQMSHSLQALNYVELDTAMHMPALTHAHVNNSWLSFVISECHMSLHDLWCLLHATKDVCLTSQHCLH